MGDRKLLFPLLLFAIFFFLIAVTGFFQITIIKRDIEGLLRDEGETLFRSIAREIEMNMEYLSLIERSPSIITPNFLNVTAYDEAIIDDLYGQLMKIGSSDQENVSLDHILILDKSGKQVLRKGSINVKSRYIRSLLKNDRQSLIRMPTDEEKRLLMGIKLPDRLVFLSLGSDELESLRKKYIMKTIIENEEKRLDVADVAVFDPSGNLYIGSSERAKDVFRIAKSLNSRHFPGYSMEILISNRLATDTFRRTSTSFITVLLFLMLGGAAAIYVIFQLERKHAEKLTELEKSMAMKERLVSLGRLASGMAHEIRNPLNAMSISIQRLKREFLPEQSKTDEYYGFLDIVRDELMRVDRIVEDFLMSTKAGQVMKRHELCPIVEEVVAMLQEKASMKRIRIENTCNPQIALDCQKERLKQVFYNVITNSIEAMNTGGSISISSAVQDGHVRVSVSDSGPGIRKDDLLKVFEYYYTTKDKGMGLGLPISFMIVKDHGGDMRVMSEEGKGTTFVITLPTTHERA
jgi:signal transduction histidine kinase